MSSVSDPSSSFSSSSSQAKPIHRPSSSAPVYANFASDEITIGAGVAIFHLATARVVVCYHSRDRYWFLPKGRRNASEDTARAAEREGFEESGYRNRLLPLPIAHRQPYPDDLPEPPIDSFDTEPLWTQLVPVSRTAQYILHWYIAETIPAEEEQQEEREQVQESSSPIIIRQPYRVPSVYPTDLTLRARIAQDSRPSPSSSMSSSAKDVTAAAGREEGSSHYEPKKHKNTGVDEEELLYESHLLPIAEAQKRLGRGVMQDVVRKGWEAVKLRMKIEEELSAVESKEEEEDKQKQRL